MLMNIKMKIKRIIKLFSFRIFGGRMKNIFLETMDQDEILLEELLKDQYFLEYYWKRNNEDASGYYRKALECDLELIEEQKGSKKK